MNTGRTDEIDVATTIGDIVAKDYRAASVFEVHGLDFCCGGKVSLGEVCRSKGLDPKLILSELAVATSTPADRGKNYIAWDLPFLADFIVNTHHSWLRENNPLIAGYTAKIASVHGTNHPELNKITELFAKIASDMTAHLREEEEVLFPTIRRIHAARAARTEPASKDLETLAAALLSLGGDHEVIGEATHEIKRLSADYKLPADACATYTLAYKN